MKITGQRLRELRRRKDLTLQEVAGHLGVSFNAIAMYERGERIAPTDKLEALASYYSVSVDYLLGRTDDPRPVDKITEQKIDLALADDPELLAFWDMLKQREDLRLLFKQVKPLTPESIKRIMRIIKAIEDEEAASSDI